MFRRKVDAPDGVEVEARPPLVPASRWLGRGRHRRPARFPDLGDADDIFGAILLAVFAVIAAVFLALLLFNVVVLAIELTILILGLLIGLFSRVVLRKPWTVFAIPAADVEERHVVGWRASRRAIDELAGEVESGRLQLALRDRRRLDD